MAFLRRSSSFGLVVVVLTITGVARADAGDEPDPDAPPPPAREAHDDLLVTGTAGVFADRGDTGGSLGAAVLRQQGWLGYGVTFDYGGKLFDYEDVGAAPMVGLFVDSPRWVRVGLAGSLGLHSYSGVEKGFLSRDPGATGTTGYVGARLFLGGEAGGAARFHFGFQLFAEEDLARVRRTYSFEQSSFGGTSRPETVTHTVGAFRCGTLLAIGGAFDL